MSDILVRAGCFVAIIVFGYVLRRLGVFQENDIKVLSKIILKLTLPAAIITGFAGRTIEPSMLGITLLGLGACLLCAGIADLAARPMGKDQQAFDIINSTGYNIGNFTMPFVQSFLGPVGIITTSLFDAGNGCMGLGGSYSLAVMKKGGGKFSMKTILRSLSRSVAFDCYVVMVVMSLLKLPLPGPVLSLVQTIGGANAFLAMLMIGIGLKFTGERTQIGTIVRLLSIRYVVGIVLALVCWFVLPLELEVRKTLVILLFAPIASTGPAYTAELGGDVGSSSAVNSVSILCSVVVIVALLLVLG